MADGVDATSFEFYEGIRIILPGALTVALADAVVRTASSDGKGLGLDALPAVVASVLIGLVFHFIDAPAKATVYRSGLPTATLAEFGSPKKGTTSGNNYFVTLDVDMPPGIKARALYMGSMYRIGYEATFLLVGVAAVVISQPLWTARVVTFDAGRMPEPLWIGLCALGSAWACAWYAQRINASRRQAAHRQRPGALSGDRSSDLAITSIAVALLLVLFLVAAKLDVARWALAIPASIELLHWAYRYSKGYPKSADDRALRRARRFMSAFRSNRYRKLPPAAPPERRKADSIEATRPVAVGSALLLSAYSAAPIYTGWLDQQELTLWLIGLVLGVVLVVARGHEVKLGGAYATQRTWLLLNKEAIVDKYCDPDPPGQDSSTT